MAWVYRREARMKARSRMKPEDRDLLEGRDLKIYGDRNGPSYGYTVEKYGRLGFEGDELYEQIVKSALRTNKTI